MLLGGSEVKVAKKRTFASLLVVLTSCRCVSNDRSHDCLIRYDGCRFIFMANHKVYCSRIDVVFKHQAAFHTLRCCVQGAAFHPKYDWNFVKRLQLCASHEHLNRHLEKNFINTAKLLVGKL